MTDKEVMQMALDALADTWTSPNDQPEQFEREIVAMEALEAALSRPEPEPVADGIQVIEHVRNVQYKIKSRYHLENGTELYTAPPRREWKELDRKEMLKIIDAEEATTKTGLPMFYRDQCLNMCRAIEAKLKEKNT